MTMSQIVDLRKCYEYVSLTWPWSVREWLQFPSDLFAMVAAYFVWARMVLVGDIAAHHMGSTSTALVAGSTFVLAADAYEGYEGLGVPNDQATPLENGFGLLFTAFCCWYFLKVVKKRAARAKDIRLSNTLSVRSSHHHSALFLILFPAERRAQTARR